MPAGLSPRAAASPFSPLLLCASTADTSCVPCGIPAEVLSAELGEVSVDRAPAGGEEPPCKDPAATVGE